MFFTVSKLGEIVVLHPLNLNILLLLVGLLLVAASQRRLGLFILAIAIVLLAIAAFSPISALLLRPLEDRFPEPPPNMDSPAGIIVLGGALDEDISAARGSTTIGDAAARLTAGVELARRYPHAKLIFTGGSANLRGRGLDEARGVRALWLALGVPAAQMIFEDKSRNTFENATMTRALVHPAPGSTYLLVTSAAHMPRSMGIFRHNGWSVTAYPVDYRTFGDSRDFWPTTLSLDSLRRLDVAVHEWAGLLAYRLTGKTNALLPAP